MASLGELTAGIAHEIQNPLNFVNNFSEVNNELIEEMKEQLAIGKWQQAIGIADDIKDNGQKISHHGKRADAIVKGMLEHSRQTKGVKEPADINALCDEYLRLAYHGLQAKDKSFNVKIATKFDESIGKINVVPQEIGRVMLNLINNAFYAVTEKKMKNPGTYEPAVMLMTKKLNGGIEIRVKDNGPGIPKHVEDKIFQPFFTAKPAGQGTGLGLSLAYDVITKGHGGKIRIDTTSEGDGLGASAETGTEFIIELPTV
jgi:signal transduction histidine kinase